MRGFELLIFIIILASCADNNLMQTDADKKSDHSIIITDSLAASLHEVSEPGPPVIILLQTRPKPGASLIPGNSNTSRLAIVKRCSAGINLMTTVQILATLPLAITGTFNTDDGLALNGISKAFKDSKDRLWFAMQGAGISCFDGKSSSNFNTSNNYT